MYTDLAESLWLVLAGTSLASSTGHKRRRSLSLSEQQRARERENKLEKDNFKERGLSQLLLIGRKKGWEREEMERESVRGKG